MDGEFYTGHGTMTFTATNGEFDNGDLDNGHMYAPPRWLDIDGNELYTFLGWSYSSMPNRKVDFVNPIAEGLTKGFFVNTTVYAVWKVNNNYTVTFFPNIGEWPEGDTTPITVGTIDGVVAFIPWAFTPRYPIREDFNFTEWNTNIDGSGNEFLAETIVEKNTFAYAQWASQISNIVTVTFAYNDGTGRIYEYITINSGDTIYEQDLPEDPTTDNERIFEGWYTESNCINQVTFPQAFDTDTVLYAKWKTLNDIISFSFTKIAEDTALPLQGAVFEFYKRHDDIPEHVHDEYYFPGSLCWTLVDSQTSDSNGQVEFNELEEGIFVLVELETPKGFSLPMGQWQITIDLNASPLIQIKAVGNHLPPAFIIDTNDGTTTYTLPNLRPLIIPLVGGYGRLVSIILGILFMTTAIIFLIRYLFKRK